jgi:phage-related tail fiber protein
MAITLNGTTGISSPAINAGNIVGQVCFFAMSTAPTGFLKCNGATISRTTYADLFAVIGTTYGSGDGSTTFALPDLRGEFLRSLDDGRGVDSGRAIGTTQTQKTEDHQHLIPIGWDSDGANVYTGTVGGGPSYGSEVISFAFTRLTNPGGVGTGAGRFGYSRATLDGKSGETRPRNVALLACIKF